MLTAIGMILAERTAWLMSYGPLLAAVLAGGVASRSLLRGRI